MSSHMSGRLDLTPADLDRLEDALEDLELSSASDELAGDDPVAQRLTEYRELMVLARDAMPLEDVPAGLLDGVIAQARQAAAAAPAAAAAAPSFWSRWRLSLWAPALAFAGSAALLLVMLVPERAESPAAEVAAAAPDDARQDHAKADAKAADASAADGRLALAEPTRQEERALAEGEVRAGGVVIGERAPEPAPPAAQASVEQAEAPSDDAAAPQRHKDASGDKRIPLPGAVTEPKPVPKAPSTAGAGAKGKKEPPPDPLGGVDTGKRDEDEAQQKTGDPWSEISRADADRRSGSCGLAKMRYDKLRKLDDARVRARALAGAGLCAVASDDPSTAKKLFEQARAADPGVSSFIDDELARLEGARTNASDPAPRAGDSL